MVNACFTEADELVCVDSDQGTSADASPIFAAAALARGLSERLSLLLLTPERALVGDLEFREWLSPSCHQAVSTPVTREERTDARARSVDYVGQLLEGLWLRDILTTMQRLRLSSSAAWNVLRATRDLLARRSRACFDAVDDPEAALSHLDSLTWQSVARTASIPNDQARELFAFLVAAGGRNSGRPMWSQPLIGLPRTTEGPTELTPAQQIILDMIRRFRGSVRKHTDLRPQGPGFIYGGHPQRDQAPAEVESGDATATGMWNELNSEGSAAAINTWDTAVFSWGRGWAASGGLPDIIRELTRTAPDLIDELYQAGFGMTPKGEFLYVDLEMGFVHEGADALRLLRSDAAMLSLLIEAGESPEHEVALNEATWSALKRRQALPVSDTPSGRRIAASIATWDVAAKRFVEHCLHWTTALRWEDFLVTGGDLAKIATFMIRRMPGEYRVTLSGARVAVHYGYVPLVFAEHALDKFLVQGRPKAIVSPK